MEETNAEREDTFSEIDVTEHVLNLDYYLHRSIIKWQDALEMGIRNNAKLDDGLIARALYANMAMGCAEAKDIIHWKEQEVTDEKNRSKIEKNNIEAKIFKEKLESFKKSLETNLDDNMKKVMIADFEMIEILKSINRKGMKDIRVII